MCPNPQFAADLDADLVTFTAQKMKVSIKDFFTERDQIRRKLRIWSDSLKKSLIENFILPPSYNWAQKSSEIN